MKNITFKVAFCAFLLVALVPYNSESALPAILTSWLPDISNLAKYGSGSYVRKSVKETKADGSVSETTYEAKGHCGYNGNNDKMKSIE